MSVPTPGSQAWLDQVVEDIVEPDLPIIDPHHHLWRSRRGRPYLLEQLWADTSSGHRIEKTVFLECGAGYREGGPEDFRCVGETELVASEARRSAEGEPGRAVISGIVSRADLSRPSLGDVLDAHEEAGGGLFRGIRHSGARDPHPAALSIPGRAPERLYASEGFRRGVALLGERGLTYDTWHYHHQNRDFAALARAVPGTTMVLDHFGTPLGVGPYAGRREEILAAWKDDIAEIAACPNVVAKLGGLAMPDNGFGWDRRATPATSDELVAEQGRYYRHTLACFGAERCMMESNFPVDRLSISYAVLWNALKKIAADLADDEKHAVFYGTAARVYRLA